jgi:hypothetical protein
MIISPDLGQTPLDIEKGPAKEMLSVRRDGAKHFVRINSSSLSVLQTCARKSQYALKLGLKAKTQSPATLFGSAIHKALEAFYSLPKEMRILPRDFAKQTDLLIPQDEAALELEAKHPLYACVGEFLRKALPLRALPDSDKRSLSAGVWSLTHYFTTYVDDPFVVKADASGPITERFCEAVLHDSDELQITYFGTIDCVLENCHNGVVLPCDHKTTSVLGSDFYTRLNPNAQYSGYLFLAQNCLGIDTDSFLVNALQVKPRPTTARGTPPNFVRQITKRTPDDIAEFKEAVVHSVQSYLSYLATDVWPIGDVNACSMYGGCTYHNVCSAPRVLRSDVISANYERAES